MPQPPHIQAQSIHGVVVNNTNTVNTWLISQSTNTNTSIMMQKQSMLNQVNAAQSTVVPVYTNSSSNVITLMSPPTLREILENEGFELKPGVRLQIIDGEPVVVTVHDDGTEGHRDLSHRHRGVIDLTKRDHAFLPGTVMRLPDGNILQVDKDGVLIEESYAHARKDVVNVRQGTRALYECLAFCNFSEIRLPDGANTKATFILPNDVKIHLFPDDHIEIDESDGHQLYRTNPTMVRNFNKYLNASDLLEGFIAWCAEQKVTRKEFSDLPISLFIYWLIVMAAEEDGDSTEEVAPLLDNAVKQRKDHKHRCKCCGKFLKAKLEIHGIHFCSSQHMDKYLQKMESIS